MTNDIFRQRRVRVPLIATLCLFWSIACTAPSVTVHGTPVDDAAFVAAVVTVHTAEVATVALGTWLIQQHRDACRGLSDAAKRVEVACSKARAHLTTYATVYSPKILLAIQGARAALTIVATSPRSTTLEKIHEAVALVQTALATVRAWGQSVGWVPESLAPEMRDTP